MNVQNRDYKHLATPRLLRLFRAFRRARPMAIALARKPA